MDDPSFYTSLTPRYEFVGGPVSINGGAGRFGSAAWVAIGNNASQLRKTVAVTSGTATVALSIKIANIAPGTIIAFMDSGNVQVDLRMSASTGTLFVTRNGTQIGATSTNNLLANVWYRIEFQTNIDPSSGTIEVRVNGTSTGWIPITNNLNTRATGNSSFNQIALFAPQAGSVPGITANDLVLTDSNSPNAGFLGDKRCYLLTPASDSSVAWTPVFASWVASTAYAFGAQILDSNGNVQRCSTAGTSGSGSHPTWATTGGTVTSDGATLKWNCVGTGTNPGVHNWMAVSENPSDGDSSYNQDSTPGDTDLFAHTTLPVGVKNLVAVDNVVYARKDDAGTRTIQSVMKSGSTQVGATNLNLSTSYVFNDFIQGFDPNTSSSWTTSGVNALLVGYKEIA